MIRMMTMMRAALISVLGIATGFADAMSSVPGYDAPPVPPDVWVTETQHDALKAIHVATEMNKSLLFDWSFDPAPSRDYCYLSWVRCDEEGYVTALELNETGLSGTLPDIFGELPRLRRLRAFNNSIHGPVPPSLLQMAGLQQLNLGHNYLTGVFPDFSEMISLRRLILDRNAFSGTLPDSLCTLSDLEVLEISTVTKMWGTIPDCFGDLSSLIKFRFTDVGLTGTIPSGLCSDEREMNGLSRNPFGCDAVGCSMGYFQQNVGRKTDSEKPCRKCDVPSNVIGSTTCQWQPRPEQGTAEPPVSSLAPSAVPPNHTPTSLPSVASSSIPTLIPSTQPTPLPTLLLATNTPLQRSVPPTSTAPSPLPTIQQTRAPTFVPTSLQPSAMPSSFSPSSNPTLSSEGKSVDGIMSGTHRVDDSGKSAIVSVSVVFAAAAVIVLSVLLVRKRRSSTRYRLTVLDDASDDLAELPLKDSAAPSYKVEYCRSLEEVPASPEPVKPSILKPPSMLQLGGRAAAAGECTESPRKVRFSLPEPRSLSSGEEGEAVAGSHESSGGPDNESYMAWWKKPLFDAPGLCCDSEQVLQSSSYDSSINSLSPILSENELTSSDDAPVSSEADTRRVLDPPMLPQLDGPRQDQSIVDAGAASDICLLPERREDVQLVEQLELQDRSIADDSSLARLQSGELFVSGDADDVFRGVADEEDSVIGADLIDATYHDRHDEEPVEGMAEI